MKELPRVPGTRILCPEDCRYRDKRAPFCGYCLPEVLKKLGSDTEKRRIRDMNADTIINIGDMDDLKELVRGIPEKIIYRVDLRGKENINEQDDG